jgi:Uma2 family endonuclease
MSRVDASLIEAIEPPPPPLIHYPESDGQPMGDNDLQRDWILMLVENLQGLLAHQQAYVTGNLFWYPVEGNNRIVQAPDTMVVLGRPPGRRRTYKQWEEAGIAPQVVFEVLSHSNTTKEMLQRLQFYNLYGVEEYYVIDPEAGPPAELEIWLRGVSKLEESSWTGDWISPRLGIRFQREAGGLAVFHPDGYRFEKPATLMRRIWSAEERAQAERERAQTERERAQAQQERAQAERERAERLAEKLRRAGIDPDQ